MPPEDDGPLTRENLLWEPDAVAHFLIRDAAYQRFRDRSQTGIPTLSAQVYAHLVALLRSPAASPDRLELSLQELREFRVVALDRTLADVYGQVSTLCLASARNREEPLEPWFVWNVALHRLHGCRILTNDRARYVGLVAPESLV